jgi:chemotaxis protein methyltransferase WspC
MNVRDVAEHLQSRIGVDSLSLGANMLSRLVAHRMRILGLTNPQRYAAHLRESAEELTALIDDVVVSETWFFRGGKVFAFLAEQVRQATRAEAPARTFRILSAPCSTGEEPYSMVIALAEAGITRDRWMVLGIDLSARSLATGRRGIYRETSFREIPDPLRRKYFQKSESGWELDLRLREAVRYRQGNLIDPKLLREEQPFDLIFCRNVLIYLSAEARKAVLANLDRLLAPQGLLCMGHAEPLSLLDPRYQPIGAHDLFLFQRRNASERGQTLPPRAMLVASRKYPRSSAPLPRRPHAPAAPVSPSVEAPSVDLLLQARREADAGALEKALQTCQAHVAAAQPSAHAYSLLGVIHQARRESSRAVECFRRALYLDPHHDEALLHLLLLYQEEGNQAAATRLRGRLERKMVGGEA